jgi:hypothetical protein
MMSPAYALMHYDSHSPHFTVISFTDVVHVFSKAVVLNISLALQNAVRPLAINR